jgi:hypothetical protein
LRQNNKAAVRPLCIIANANGHNWIWKLWINGAQEVEEIDPASGQYLYRTGEYECITASTWANQDNLPPDFIADLKRKEVEAPNHFRQYVLNSDEELNEDDFVFNFTELMASKSRAFNEASGYGHRITGFDIARYGNDKCAAVCIQQVGALAWKTCHVEQWDHRDLDYTTGRILSTSASLASNDNIVDEDGLGAGPLDFIQKGRKREDFRGFRNPGYSYEDNKFYGNPRTAAAFKLREMVSKGHIAVQDEALCQELMTLRYRYMNDGRKILVSKEDMRKKGVKSPNLADAILMAASVIGDVKYDQDRQYRPKRNEYSDESLFKIAGV